MNFEKETDTMKAIFLGLWIVFAVVLIVCAIILTISKNIPTRECIEYGSIEHRVAYATDYNLASWIKRNGHELGPYFDYKFCEEED